MPLVNPNQLQKVVKIKGLIYGQPGIGKSTVALTMPNPMMFDFDKGMYRVDGMFQVPSVQVDSYTEVKQMLESGRDIADYDTIVVDTLGKLIDRMGDDLAKANPKVKQANGALSMQGWGQVKIEFQNFLRLVERQNKHIIFVAHEREEKNNETVMKRPDVAGSSGKDIVKELDFMGYMSMIADKRTIDFAPSESFYAKNSLGLNSYIEIPTLDVLRGFLTKSILEKAEQRAEEKSINAENYDKLVYKTSNLIKEIKTPEEATSMLDSIGHLNHVWDSLLQCKKMLKDRTDELGMVYDRGTKAFIFAENIAQQQEDVKPKESESNEEVSDNSNTTE